MTSPTDDIVKGANDGVIGIIQLDDTSTEANKSAGTSHVAASGALSTGGAPVTDLTAACSDAAAGATANRSPEQAEELVKVVVFNVGLHATSSQLEKLLKSNGIAYKKARKTPAISHGILSFETEEQRSSAMEKISKLKGPRGGEMMKPVLQQNNRKRGADGRDAGNGSKRHCKEEDRKTVAQATASLYGVKTYAEQLTYKEHVLRDSLFLKLPGLVRRAFSRFSQGVNEWEKRLGEWKRNMRNKQAQTKKDSRGDGGDVAGKLTYPPELRCPSWCRTFKRRDGVVPFDVCPIVPSPEQEGYRNKCEFTLSLAKDGKPTAGFRASGFQEGVAITAESPNDCPQVHRNMKKLCAQMDTFMRSSAFPVYDDTAKTGVWRFLLLRRSAADDETMAKVVVNPTGLGGSDEWQKEGERLVKELSAGAQGEEGTKLVSLWVQEYAGVSAPDEASPLRLVWGKERIEEALLGLRFTISPNSFFQVNTKGAEALYRVVIENLELGEDVMVMDVCCGAGTIGICAAAAGGAKHVYGSDLCLPAIEDAKRNAEANGIKNCDFVCGKARTIDVVADQLYRARKQHRQDLQAVKSATAGGSQARHSADSSTEIKFAAVLDPPRSGVHAKCLRALRGTKAIKRLVYVSCNPTKSLPSDALLLCSPVSKSTAGMPFRPIKAIPVDMFPHTPHMELVMVFERIEYEIRPPLEATTAPIPAANTNSSVTHAATPGPVAAEGLGMEIPATGEQAASAPTLCGPISASSKAASQPSATDCDRC
ncbi:unnamed protein product [Ascophyllum nodosum]